MKISKIFYLLIFLFITSNSFSQDKIAFINLDNVIKNTKIGSSVIQNIEKLNNQNLKLLEKKQADLKQLENEINSKKNIVSEAETLKDIKILKDKIKLFNSEKNKMVKELNSFKKEELDKLMVTINEVIQSYMEKNSIEILLDSKYIYIGSKNSDLTKVITDQINNLN